MGCVYALADPFPTIAQPYDYGGGGGGGGVKKIQAWPNICNPRLILDY